MKLKETKNCSLQFSNFFFLICALVQSSSICWRYVMSRRANIWSHNLLNEFRFNEFEINFNRFDTMLFTIKSK